MYRNQCISPVAYKRLTGVTEPVLRCGKCPACLRQKRNELAVRALREFKGQKIAFLTFTYDQEHCPIFHSEVWFSSLTGEVFKESQYLERNSSFFDNAPFIWKHKWNKVQNKLVHIKRYEPWQYDEEIMPGIIIRHTLYQSIDYEDVKLMLKRFRQAYPDTLNHYIIVPEYGANGYRPHYHMLVYGLDQEHLDWFKDDWLSRYADEVDVQQPKPKDGLSMNDQIGKISMYIAKYCVKGDFDCPYIKQGLCKKPRRSVSQNFGLGSAGDLQRLKDQLNFVEVFGHYEPKTVDTFEFGPSGIKLLASRRKCDVNGYVYPVPKYIIKKLFYNNYRVVKHISKVNRYESFSVVPPGEKVQDYKSSPFDSVVYVSRASQLQREVANAILADFCKDAIRKQEDSQGTIWKNDSMPDEFIALPQTSQSDERPFAVPYFLSELERSSIY